MASLARVESSGQSNILSSSSVEADRLALEPDDDDDHGESDLEDGSLYRSHSYSTAASCPCPLSILRNPLPKGTSVSSSKRKPPKYSVFVTQRPSPPPPHWTQPPDGDREDGRRSNSAQAPPTRDGVDSDQGEGDGASLSAVESGECFEGKGKLKFAPLPPGRRMFRSNSLSIGVAARARMLSSQGGACPNNQPRYAGESTRSSFSSSNHLLTFFPSFPLLASHLGPQQWYQPGGSLPPDVYTYKDVQKGLGKMWSKLRRSSSATSSTASADAAALEREGKDGGNEIEHIEETNEDEQVDEDGVVHRVEHVTLNGRGGKEEEEEEEEERGRQLGFDPSRMVETPGVSDHESFDSIFSASTSASTTTGPRTPEDFQIDHHHHSVAQGKRVDRGEEAPMAY